jgi:nucleoside-diphosphate-sugar epimerase
VGNTASTREFNYVTDTVTAFELALTAPDIEGETMNIGNSYELKISDVIEELKIISGANFEIVVDSSRIRPEKSEVQRLLSESSKARRLLNWNADYSGKEGFSKGLRKTFEWFSQPANLARYRNDGNTL